jgi:hypothetical protein
LLFLAAYLIPCKIVSWSRIGPHARSELKRPTIKEFSRSLAALTSCAVHNEYELSEHRGMEEKA